MQSRAFFVTVSDHMKSKGHIPPLRNCIAAHFLCVYPLPGQSKNLGGSALVSSCTKWLNMVGHGHLNMCVQLKKRRKRKRKEIMELACSGQWPT